MISALFLCRFINVGRAEDLIFKNAPHPLDLLQSLAVAVWALETGGSQLTQLSLNVKQLPVQVLSFVALLLNPFHCRMNTNTAL